MYWGELPGPHGVHLTGGASLVVHFCSRGGASLDDKKNELEAEICEPDEGGACLAARELRGWCIKSRKLMTIPPGRKSPQPGRQTTVDRAYGLSRTSGDLRLSLGRISGRAHRIQIRLATAYSSLRIRSMGIATRSGRIFTLDLICIRKN